MPTKYNIFGEGLIRGKRTKFALQIARKALKCPIQYVNFPKISGVACPRTPENHFCFPICFKFNFARKNTLKNVKIWCEYTSLTRTHFQKRVYLHPFSGVTSLHSVNISPQSKLHPPNQNFLDPPLSAIQNAAFCLFCRCFGSLGKLQLHYRFDNNTISLHQVLSQD